CEWILRRSESLHMNTMLLDHTTKQYVKVIHDIHRDKDHALIVALGDPQDKFRILYMNPWTSRKIGLLSCNNLIMQLGDFIGRREVLQLEKRVRAAQPLNTRLKLSLSSGGYYSAHFNVKQSS